MLREGQDHSDSPEGLCIIMLLLRRQRGALFHFTSIFSELMNCSSRWSVTRDRGQTATLLSSKGYFDFPLMPSRRAFMFGNTFFIIFPKSAALSGW